MLQLSTIESGTLELLKKLQKSQLLGKARYIFMALKSLTYFDDAETDIMPDMLIKKSWKQAKKEILAKSI